MDRAKNYSKAAAGESAKREEEDEVQLAMKLAGQIFQDADTDNSGALDVPELSKIITNLFESMGKELPHDYQVTAKERKNHCYFCNLTLRCCILC